MWWFLLLFQVDLCTTAWNDFRQRSQNLSRNSRQKAAMQRRIELRDFSFVLTGTQCLIELQKVKVCDATEDYSSNAVDAIKKYPQCEDKLFHLNFQKTFGPSQGLRMNCRRGLSNIFKFACFAIKSNYWKERPVSNLLNFLKLFLLHSPRIYLYSLFTALTSLVCYFRRFRRNSQDFTTEGGG